jgi:DNA repair protein RecO (recombination protein O)
VARSRLYRTPAIILKRMDLGEADRIVTLYTRDVGKVRAVAKGVRRTVSRSAGHLEPFTLSDVLFAVGRELDVISQADTLEAFRTIREDLELTTHAYYLAEVVDLLTEDHLENRAVFDTLLDGLRTLGSAADARLVVIVFHLKLLDALGFRPELRECVSCRATIEPERNHFSALLGGVLCPACGPREPTARAIGTSALKLMRFLQLTEGRHAVLVPAHVGREAEALLRDYAEHIIERRLRSPALIARVQEASLSPEVRPTATCANSGLSAELL